MKYAPYCRHYKDTYLERAICKLDGERCRLEVGVKRECKDYEE